MWRKNAPQNIKMLHNLEKEAIIALKAGDKEKWNALYERLNDNWTCEDMTCDCRIIPKKGLVSAHYGGLTSDVNKQNNAERKIDEETRN